MSLATQIKTALASVMTQIPDSVVTVSYAGKTTSGMKKSGDEQSLLTQYGEQGQDRSAVRIVVGTIDYPERGKPIMIAGEQMTIVDVNKNSVDSVYDVSYTKTRPTEFTEGT